MVLKGLSLIKDKYYYHLRAVQRTLYATTHNWSFCIGLIPLKCHPNYCLFLFLWSSMSTTQWVVLICQKLHTANVYIRYKMTFVNVPTLTVKHSSFLFRSYFIHIIRTFLGHKWKILISEIYRQDHLLVCNMAFIVCAQVINIYLAPSWSSWPLSLSSATTWFFRLHLSPYLLSWSLSLSLWFLATT